MAQADGAPERPPFRERLADALIVLGAAAVSAGVWMIHEPAGVIAAGVSLIVIALFGVSGGSR